MDSQHTCTICLERVYGAEYWEYCFAHQACVEYEQGFPLRTTGTPPDILNQHPEETNGRDQTEE